MKTHLLRASALAGMAGFMIIGQANAQTTTSSNGDAVEALVITGSRIPRIATEGPAPPRAGRALSGGVSMCCR